MRWRAGGRVIPAAGGGGGGLTAAWQPYLPASTTPDLDPNSIVSGASISGDYLEIELQSPGAYPLPTQGALWDCGGLVDAYGSAYTADGCDPPLIGARTDTLLPADTWVGALVATGTPAVSGVEAFGIILDATGNITTYQLATSGSQQSSTSTESDTDLRIGMLRALPSNTSTSRYGGGVGYSAAGTPVASRGLALSFIIGSSGWSRVWLGAGWVAGTGSAPATVRVSGRTLGALASRWITDGGL
jgi:hypothetical protein